MSTNFNFNFDAISDEQLCDLIFQANKELKTRGRKEYITNVKNVLDAISPLVKNCPDTTALRAEDELDWATLYDWIQEELKFFMEN